MISPPHQKPKGPPRDLQRAHKGHKRDSPKEACARGEAAQHSDSQHDGTKELGVQRLVAARHTAADQGLGERQHRRRRARAFAFWEASACRGLFVLPAASGARNQFLGASRCFRSADINQPGNKMSQSFCPMQLGTGMEMGRKRKPVFACIRKCPQVSYRDSEFLGKG